MIKCEDRCRELSDREAALADPASALPKVERTLALSVRHAFVFSTRLSGPRALDNISRLPAEQGSLLSDRLTIGSPLMNGVTAAP